MTRFIWRRATTTFVHCYAINMPGGGGAVLSALCSRKVPLIASHDRADGPVCSGCQEALQRIIFGAHAALDEATNIVRRSSP